MTKELEIFLRDILESIELIEKRMNGITYDNFIGNIIGEAVRNLPKEFRQKHPNIDWQSPADMRSVLIHGYFGIDLKVVWDTISNNLPPFKKQIKNLL